MASIRVEYNPSLSSAGQEFDPFVVAWVGVGRSTHFVRADVIIGRLPLGDTFVAEYSQDARGMAHDMRLKTELRQPIHVISEAFVTGDEDTTVLNLETVYRQNQFHKPESPSVAILYGNRFACDLLTCAIANSEPMHAQGNINPPGARFIFGSSAILDALREGLGVATPNQGLAARLYDNSLKVITSQKNSSRPLLHDSDIIECVPNEVSKRTWGTPHQTW